MQELDPRRDMMVPDSLQGQLNGLYLLLSIFKFQRSCPDCVGHPGGQVRYYTKVGGVICRGVRP